MKRRLQTKNILAVMAVAATFIYATASVAAGMLYSTPYAWASDRGGVVPLSSFAGRPTVITMAYGACRKVCSTTLRRMEELQQQADRDGVEVNFVVVSLDPKTDTPEAWREYRKWRGLGRANWNFLTGDAAQTRNLAAHLGIGFWRYDDHVLHDFGISLLDREGNLVQRLKWADSKLDGFMALKKSGAGLN